MFVKPHDVPPLLCFNMQTEMRFWVEQLLFTTPTLWKRVETLNTCIGNWFINGQITLVVNLNENGLKITISLKSTEENQ